MRRNNVNLLKLFLGRWLYATPLDLEMLLSHLAAPVEEKTGSDRRQFGMQLLVLGADCQSTAASKNAHGTAFVAGPVCQEIARH